MQDIFSFLTTIEAPNGQTRQGLLLKAILFASEKHKNQYRKGANHVPYIHHPLAVMTLLSMAGITDEGILSAAVLHDTVEDTDATIDEISSLFGTSVATWVEEVSDDKGLSKLDRKTHQIERVRAASDAAKLIKIADKISNVFDTCVEPPPSWTALDAQGYACWSKKVVEAARIPNNIPHDWLIATFQKVLKEGVFRLTTDQHVLQVPILPADEETCLTQYYASLKK